MAQGKRGKSQARRSGGDGLPGWAWLIIGVALTLLVVLAAPKLLKRGDDGFFRPTPNPDAQPRPVEDDAVVDEATLPETPARPVTAPAGRKDAKSTDYDFYTLLPGREVPMSDAELAASEQAEQRAQAKAAQGPAQQAAPVDGAPAPLPAPVDDTAAAPAPAPPAPAATPAPAPTPAKDASADTARYLLQAGAFEASGQAEELKAKIAMLGLGARVESAQIGGKTVYRVRMGPYGSASELAEAKRKLASGGLPAMAVKVN